MDYIPDNYKSAKLDTNRRFTCWTLRVDGSDETNVNVLRDFMKEYCTKGIIGPIEKTGKYRNHFHATFRLRKEMSQSALAKKLVNVKTKVHLEDYCLTPSAHYFTDKYTMEHADAYAAKSGEPMFTLNTDVKKAREKVKENNKDKQKKFREEHDIPEDTPQLMQYAEAMKILGEQEAKRLYPMMHYSANGVRVQKENVNADALIQNAKSMHKGLWVTGPPGKGKSSFVSVLHPGAYRKDKDEKYWESYNYMDNTINNSHMCVFFDEVGTVEDLLLLGGGKSLDKFKIMFDKHPFTISIKHAAQKTTRFQKGIVAGNDSWQNIKNEICKQANNGDPKNPLRGFDARQFCQAVERRFNFVDIDEVLDVYKQFTIKEDSNGFGGVFCNKLKKEIQSRYNKLQRQFIDETKDLTNDDQDDYVLLEHEHAKRMEELRLEMHNRTIQSQEPRRWIRWETLRNPETVQDRIEQQKKLILDISSDEESD